MKNNTTVKSGSFSVSAVPNSATLELRRVMRYVPQEKTSIPPPRLYNAVSLTHAFRATIVAVFSAIVILVMPDYVSAQYSSTASGPNTPEEGLHCGSPRFIVKSGDNNAFALKRTEVQANIIGVLADVQVKQVYVNSGKTPVEATYIFPASTRAAVYGMTMTVKDRVINAVVKEKQQARQVYQQAVSSGHTASLLEQLKPNVFQMSVGNIGSNDSVVVVLHYSEAIAYAEGEYEFVYPAVVGPRYASSVNAADFQAVLSSMDLPKEIPGDFSLNVSLATGVALKQVESPSHKLDIHSVNAGTNAPASMSDAKSITSLSPQMGGHDANRDFVLHYRLSGPAIESGLLLSKSNDENFFMLMVQPPRQVEIPNILPREYVFIVDVSGSMQGKPLQTAQRLMSDLLDKLRPTDRFNILCFSGSQLTMSDNSVELTPGNKERARNFLNNGFGGGGTELLPALQRAFGMNAAEGFSRNFVVITDGFVQCEPQAFDLVRKNLNKANIYAFGIGQSVNRFLMEGLARAGNAEPMIVTDMNEAPKMADKFREYIEAPVLTHISVDFGKLDAYDVDPISIPDVSAKRPIIVFGKWKGEASGLVSLHGTAANGAYDVNIDLSAEPIRPENSALRYLWARNRIRLIQDGAANGWGYATPMTTANKQAITDLGLKYNLLTDYTSFVAVDSVISVAKQDAQLKAPQSVDSVAFKKEPEVQQGYYNTTGGTGSAMANTLPKMSRQKIAIPQASPQQSGSADANSIADKKVPGQLVTSGALNTAGGVSIRGSHASETKMLIDGQDVSDTISGGLGTAATSTGDMKYAPTAAKPAQTNIANQTTSNTNTSNASNSAANASNAHNVGTENTSSSNSSTPVTSVVGGASANTSYVPQVSNTQADIGVTRSNASSSYGSTTGGVINEAIDGGDGGGEESPLCVVSHRKPLYVGPVIDGSSSTWLASNDAAFSIRDNNFKSRDLKGSGFGAGFSAEYLLGDARTARSAFIADLTYQSSTMTSTATQNVSAWQGDTFDSTTVPASVQYKTQLSSIQLNVSFHFNLGRSPFRIFLGLGPGIVTSSRSIDIATLGGNALWYRPFDSTVLPTDQSGKVVYLRDADATTKLFLLRLRLGLEYEFIFKRFIVTPFVSFEPTVVGPSTNALRGGVRFLVPLKVL